MPQKPILTNRDENFCPEARETTQIVPIGFYGTVKQRRNAWQNISIAGSQLNRMWIVSAFCVMEFCRKRRVSCGQPRISPVTINLEIAITQHTYWTLYYNAHSRWLLCVWGKHFVVDWSNDKVRAMALCRRTSAYQSKFQCTHTHTHTIQKRYSFPPIFTGQWRRHTQFEWTPSAFPTLYRYYTRYTIVLVVTLCWDLLTFSHMQYAYVERA